jgi:peptidoglycan/LPS O-acetylase OafA/YrhL
MPITITNVSTSSLVVISTLIVAVLLTLRKTQYTELFPVGITEELKGVGILSVVFAHISYMLVSDNHFLYPLSIAGGVGVDLFLLMSGYGLTVSMLKKKLSVSEFYRRRLIKVFIPFWLVLIILFIADENILHITYTPKYILDSLMEWFPQARAFDDVDSPLWYINWLVMFYVLFPILFMPKRPWLTAILLAVIANIIAITDPLHLQANWLHRLHTNAFSLGMLLAWLLARKNGFSENIAWFKNKSEGPARPFVLALSLGLATYMIYHGKPGDWPLLTSVLTNWGANANFFIGQTTSLIAMAMLVIVFSLKRLDCKVLYLFGLYSYETYLLHWPLLERYDHLFNYFPAWLAVIIWLCIFIGLGWLLQKITRPISSWVDSTLSASK